MIVPVLSFHAGDIQLARRCVEWIGRISDCKRFEMVLLADADTPFDQTIKLKEAAETVFKSVTIISTSKPAVGWPSACNKQWFRAVQWGSENNRPILFLEPDCVVLKPSWLEDLNAAYESCGKQHLGAIENVAQLSLPPRVMSGVAIYGPVAGTWAPIESSRAWAVDYADLILKDAADTKLIRDFFGKPNLPPIFVKERNERTPVNALTLDWIPPESVIFHRDKSHSLIPLLRKELFNEEAPLERGKIAVVFPVHAGDVALANLHAQWLQSAQKKWAHRAVIAYDNLCPAAMVGQLQARLRDCFENVEMFRYPAPRKPYPGAANHAWQSTARHMAAGKEPWFFMEADLCVLRKFDWLEVIQDEYERAGKSWMGPHVKGMAHANGTMVYPSDAAFRMPRAMNCPDTEAFDMQAALDMMQDCHDCGAILFHTWSVLNGQWWPVGGGHVPVNITLDLAQQIPKSAVAIHRVKDHSLLAMLQSGQFQP